MPNPTADQVRAAVTQDREAVEDFRATMMKQHAMMFSGYAGYKRLYMDLCYAMVGIEKRLPATVEIERIKELQYEYRGLLRFRRMWEALCPMLRTLSPKDFEVRVDEEAKTDSAHTS